MGQNRKDRIGGLERMTRMTVLFWSSYSGPPILAVLF